MSVSSKMHHLLDEATLGSSAAPHPDAEWVCKSCRTRFKSRGDAEGAACCEDPRPEALWPISGIRPKREQRRDVADALKQSGWVSSSDQPEDFKAGDRVLISQSNGPEAIGHLVKFYKNGGWEVQSDAGKLFNGRGFIVWKKPGVLESKFLHGTVRQWQNGRHMKTGSGWERIKTGRPNSYASKMPTVLDIVQGNAPPESLGPPIAAMPSLGVVGATAESVEDMTVSEALLALDAQLSGEEAFDEDIMKMVFGVLRKVTGRKDPKANKTIPPERPGILFKTNMYKQTRGSSLRSRQH